MLSALRTVCKMLLNSFAGGKAALKKNHTFMTYLPYTGYLHREMECSFKTQLCRKCYHLLTIKFLCSWVIKMLYRFFLHRAVSRLWILENSLRESKHVFFSSFFFLIRYSHMHSRRLRRCHKETERDEFKQQTTWHLLGKIQ